VAYGVLLKPLPWKDADRIVRPTETRQGRPGRIRGTITNGTYLAWTEQPATIDALGGYSVVARSMTVRMAGSRDPARATVGRLTPSMFDVLGVTSLRGRVFVAADALIGDGAYPDPAVAILSWGLWQEWYGGRDDAIGATLHVDDVPVTVVGVMARDFAFPDRGTQMWLPMPIGAVKGAGPVLRLMIFGALAKLKPGYSPAQAAAEATARARTAPDPGLAAVSMFGSSAPAEIAVTSAVEAATADVRPAITLLLAAVTLLLATATANVSSLQLARATTRRREIAVRAAIGAGFARLGRQLLVESGLIGLAGGVVGLVLALMTHRLLLILLPADFPRLDDIALNLPVLAFALVVSVATSVACCMLPALQLRRVELVQALVEDGGTSTSGGRRSGAGRLRTMVMAGQVAVACVLLVGAMLLARSFVALLHADRGYDPVNLLTAQMDPGGEYDGRRRAALADAVVSRLSGVPGVSDAAAGNALPFVSMGGNYGFTMPSPSNPGIRQQVQTLTRLVSPTYFQTLRLRLVAGRLLTDADTEASRPAVVVNRSFSLRYLGASPIGTRLPMAFGERRPDCDVVGIVEDMRQSDVTDAPAPELFVSYRQMPDRLLNGPLILVVRTVGDPLPQAGLLRTAVREQDPAILVHSVMTMEERVVTSLAKPRLYAMMLGAFGGFALAIAAVGLFSVLSYSVAHRAREIGVRTALGAQTRDIVALVLKQAAGIAIGGVVFGLAASVLLSRFLTAFLYGVVAHDLTSFAVVAVVLMLAVALACVVPARRAARVNPLIAMRSS
jgi:putative ABC transport system permease protein